MKKSIIFRTFILFGLMTLQVSLLKAQFTPSPPNGIRYFDFNKSVGIGCSAHEFYKLRIYCDTALDRQSTLGLINKLIINDVKYGIYNKVLNGYSTQYAMYNEVDGSLSQSIQKGIHNKVIGGSDSNFGIHNIFDGSRSQLLQRGFYNQVTGGKKNNNGIDNFLNGRSSEGEQKGIFNYTIGGDGLNYGIHNSLLNEGGKRSICLYNVLNDNQSNENTFGIKNILNITTSNNGNKYGIYSVVNADTSSYAKGYYGVYSLVNSTGDGDKYGVKSIVKINGSGTKYGIYAKAPGSTNWAGYFIGRGYFSEPVAIGTTDPHPYMLAVKGSVGIDGLIQADALEVIDVTLPDYVFDKNYKLRSIEEIESYIEENQHLPEVPSAKEVEKNGLNIAEMNNALLKKVEELTLYLIEQNKQLSELKNDNAELRHMINKISSK